MRCQLIVTMNDWHLSKKKKARSYQDKCHYLRVAIPGRKTGRDLCVMGVLGDETGAIAATGTADTRHPSNDWLRDYKYEGWWASWGKRAVESAGVMREHAVHDDEAASLLEHGELIEGGGDGGRAAASVRFICEPIDPTAVSRK